MKTKVVAVKELPLADLVIGKGQVRVRDVGKDIDELATSIKKVGLLEPIVVCPAKEKGKYEILTGQRRFLACKQLGLTTIMACILEQEVSEIDAKIISITENLVRLDPNRKDLIDACTALYHKYGSIKDVAEETGLPYPDVAIYVKYDRLIPDLKKMVDNSEIDVKSALRAQDAASVSGKIDKAEAVIFAKEFAQMSGAQQTRVVEKREDDPTQDATEALEAAKSGEKVTQIVVTILAGLHQLLKKYAKDENTSVDDAAATLIEEGLTQKGYSEAE